MNETEQRRIVLPTITVAWNPETHQVGLGFKQADFKSWDFVIGTLEMAILKAQDFKKLQMMDAMQKSQQEEAVNQQLAKMAGFNGLGKG